LFDAASGLFLPDTARGRALSDRRIRDLDYGDELTFTTVPRGNGRRIGLDHNLNGILDGDESDDRD
jgi:hypothetical protein